ncbi:MAG: hypothetical protein MR383_00995 [Lachnospiraceae bacterium]|nr:hypothetical protein [Lachnospiraceae bacterium]MDD7026340.1 hypothetical protein [Lachnospiraceae bacterium]MDY5700433.1 hypothetical protein [Lachnospiraceae bacterium]
MNQESVFAKRLEEIRSLAKRQQNMVTKEQLEEAFGSLGIKEEQLEPIYDYLKSKNIGIGEPLDMEEVLSQEEKSYLEEYIETLDGLPGLTEGQKRACIMAAMAGEVQDKEKLLHAFLPQVVDIARLYTGQGLLLEDLIGEGNVALALGVEMLGCLENPDEADGMLGKMIMDAMEEAIEENTRAKQADREVMERVNQVSQRAQELAESLRRKVTIQELAQETLLEEEAIREAIRLSGNKIEHIEG